MLLEPEVINANAPHLLQPERQELVALMRRYGGITSDALLDPSCHYYREPGLEGFIGYKIENRTAVVFGDPVCPPSNRERLVSGFHHYCSEEGWSVVYISASEEFARWAILEECSLMIEFGNEFYIDPHNDPRGHTGNHGSLVRRKVKHALKEGAVVKEYLSHDKELENAIEQVGIFWLEARRGPQIHISQVRLFNDPFGKRWFYAQQGDRVVGAVVLNRLDRHGGWLMNHIVFAPDAPRGTPELLVVTALEAVAKEGCHYVTFGNSPSSQLGETQGMSAFSSWVAHLSFRVISKLFHLHGHKMFWDKFHPESRKSYLLFTDRRIGLKQLLALKNALNVSV